MTALLVAATVATANQAAARDAKPKPGAEEQATQIGELSTLDSMQGLMQLIKANQAGEAELRDALAAFEVRLVKRRHGSTSNIQKFTPPLRGVRNSAKAGRG
mgnify:CR=1 FL=1